MSVSQALRYAPKDPLQSIFNFTKEHQTLWKPQCQEFITALELDFSRLAYTDKTLKVSEEGAASLRQHHLETLFSQASKSGLRQAAFRMYQTFVTIAKVTGIALDEQKKSQAFYPISVYSDEKNYHWGWMPREVVEGSPRLKTHLEAGHLIVREGGIKPSVLFGIQRIMMMADKEETSLDISCEVLLDLILFAHEWEVDSLKPLLSRLKHSIDEKSEDWQVATAWRDDRGLKEAMKALPKIKEEERIHVTFPHYEDISERSEYFDEEQPYQSMITFSRRCCALSKEEQLRFFARVRHYFSCASTELKKDIPQALERDFVEVSLPFILDAMQVDEEGRQRLVASIQRVANKELFLQSRDSLQILHNFFGVEGESAAMQVDWIHKGVFSKKEERVSEISGPLVLRKVKAPTVLPFSLLASSKKEEVSASQLLALYLFLCGQKEQSLLEESDLLAPALKQIKAALADKECRQEMSTELVRHIGKPEVYALVESTLAEKLYPDFSLIGEVEALEFIRLRLDSCSENGDYSVFIKRHFLESPAFHQRLISIKDKVSKKQKKGIEKYFYDELIAAFPVVKEKSYYSSYSVLGNFVKNLWEEYQSYPYSYDESERRIQEIKSRVTPGGYSGETRLSEKELQQLLDLLSTAKMEELAKGAGFDKRREELIKDLQKAYPKLVVLDIKEQLLKEFFDGKLDNPVAQAILELMATEKKSERGAGNKRVLTDEESIHGYQIICSEKFKKWLKSKAPTMSHYSLQGDFDEQYKSQVLIRESNILQGYAKSFAGEEGQSLNVEGELKFLKGALRTLRKHHFVNGDLIYKLHNLMIELKIDEAGRQRLEKFFTSNDNKKLFQEDPLKNEEKLFDALAAFLPKIPVASKLKESFMQGCPKATTLLGDYLEHILLQGSALMYDSARQISKKRGELEQCHIWDDEYVEEALCLRDPALRTWMEKNTEEWVLKALEDSMGRAAYNLPVLLDVDSAMKFATAQGLVDKKGKKWLQDALKDIGRTYESDWNEENLSEKCQKFTEAFADLSLEMQKQLCRVILLEDFASCLKAGRLPQAYEKLKKFVDDGALSQKGRQASGTSSSGETGNCSVM